MADEEDMDIEKTRFNICGKRTKANMENKQLKISRPRGYYLHMKEKKCRYFNWRINENCKFPCFKREIVVSS